MDNIESVNIVRSRLSALSNPALRTRPPLQPKQNRRTQARKPFFAALAILIMTSLGCSVVTGLFNGSGNAANNGHIIAIVPGSSVDKNGQAVDSKFTFDPSEPQIAVAVQVGKLDSPAPMTITWYQVTGQGDQKLFTDTVQVSPYDRAFSIGKNPGTLAEGNYKVVAALNGQSQQIEVSVAQPVQAQSQSKSQPATSGKTPTKGGQPPISGGSGKTASPASSIMNNPSQPSFSGCHIYLMNYDLSSIQIDGPNVDIVMKSECPLSHELTATAGGAPQVVATLFGKGSLALQINPCGLPGGKDLPGSKVQFSAGPQTIGIRDYTQNNTDEVPGPFVITLGPDTTKPRVSVQYNPDPASANFGLGDTIQITVKADDNPRPGISWQSGLKSIEVKGPEGDIAPPWINPDGRMAQACKPSREHTYQATYTFTNASPDVFQLLPVVKDYDGNVNQDLANCRRLTLNQNYIPCK